MYVLCSFNIRAQSANGAESHSVHKIVDLESLAFPETQVWRKNSFWGNTAVPEVQLCEGRSSFRTGKSKKHCLFD